MKPRLRRIELYHYLAERDELICGICNESLQKEFEELWEWRSFHNKKRATINIDIDHTIPKSKLEIAMWDDKDNLRLTHKTCNCAKGNMLY